MNTRDTAVRVRGMLRCAKICYRTRTRATRFLNTAGLPVPVLNPSFVGHRPDTTQIWVRCLRVRVQCGKSRPAVYPCRTLLKTRVISHPFCQVSH